MSVGAKVYYNPVVHSLLEYAGMDRAIPVTYKRFVERFSDVREVEIEGVHCKFSTSSLFDEEFMVGEREILEDLLARVNHTDTFYDIGADAGLYSCFVQKANSGNANVVAFEPHPVRQQGVKMNAARNGVPVEIIETALSNERGVAQLSYGLNPDEEEQRGFEVSLRRGDTLIKKGSVPAPTVMKIDVEGAELDVLRRLGETIRSPECRLLYIETHPEHIEAFGGSIQDVYDELESAGSDCQVLSVRDTQDFIRATKY